ncbi:MAG: winged helix-turn-helix domain-containing protein [Gammaproteobacteria bacterium]|nr:winged helix-turn-helix domain-containing protein [Gammaproteobacteria bacterium]
MRRWPLTIGLLLSLVLSVAVPADDDQLEARRLVESGAILPLGQILNSLQDRWSGRILEVELESEGGDYVYEVELLDTQGRVWDLEVDAVSGRLLRCFMLHPNKILSKNRLIEHVYEQDFDRDSNLIEVYVRRLRDKLGKQCIQTKRGQGYVFLGETR